MSRPTVFAALAVGVALLAASGCSRTASPAPPPPPPAAATAGPVAPDPLIGAVFLGVGDLHTCAAAVLHSKVDPRWLATHDPLAK